MASPFRTPSPPPIAVPDHAGVRRRDAVYWMDPPLELGELVSAWSNQTTEGFATNRSPRALLILVVIFGPIAVALVAGAYQWLGVPGAAGCVVLIGLLVAAGYFESKARPWCSFIGERGFSEHRITWRRTDHTIVLFESVAGLWISRTEHYQNGVYRHTIEEYEWRDRAGLRLALRRVMLHEKGIAAAGARLGAGGKKRRIPTRDLMTAAAAEWRRRRVEKAKDQLTEHGAAVFPTRRGGFFSVRRGSIETDVAGKRLTIEPGDIVSSALDAGVLTIKTNDKKIRFAISDVADHEVAFALASELAGISLRV